MAVSFGLGTQLGSYRLESVLGGTESRVVYRARHVRLDTRAAVTVVSGELDEAFTARFLREIHAVAALEHAHVIPIYDAGVDDGRLYVATRYISGGGLVRMLERRGWLEPDIVPTLLGPVAAALDAAHDAGVVHGSVRPDGILLLWSKDGTLEDVYISEFGMAGHPSDYLAPEQLEGGEATARSDVYSLGCVLYHALTGRVPFARGVDRGFVGAPSVVRDMPNAVDGPVLRALSADPSKRFETCGELMAAYGAAAELRMVHDDDAPEWRPAVPDVPPEIVEAPAAPPPARGLRVKGTTALIVACTLAALGLGYLVSAVTRGQSGKRISPVAVRALAAKDLLRGIAAGGLPEFTCAFTRAPSGAAVLENASCTPKKKGTPPVERVTLALFATRPAMDGVYDRARTLSRGGGCPAAGPGLGDARWPGGRMFCLAARQPSIVWTVDDSGVLGAASAGRGSDLAAFWLQRRNLRNPLHG